MVVDVVAGPAAVMVMVVDLETKPPVLRLRLLWVLCPHICAQQLHQPIAVCQPAAHLDLIHQRLHQDIREERG